jgi:hypothetical protein
MGGRKFGGLLSGFGELGVSALQVTGIAAGLATALASVVEVGRGFRLAAEYETAGVQLRALTGSASTATTTLGDLRDIAAHSPFEFPELLDTSKRLLAVGVTAAGIPTLLREIGDVAAGVGAPIGEIADQFVRVATDGSLGSRELREFGRQGVPVVQQLAAEFHTTRAGVEALVDSGRIGFPQLEQAFASMTGAGGRFGGILAAQSQTIGGLFHGLSATVGDTLADVSEQLITALDLRPAIAGLTAGVARFGPTIVAGLASVTPYIHAWIGTVAETFGGLYAAAVPVFARVVGAIRSAWGPLSTFISEHAGTITTVFAGIGGVLSTLALPTLLGAVGTAVGLVGSALAPVVGLVGLLATPLGLVGLALGVLATRFDLVAAAGQAFGYVADLVANNWRGMVEVAVNAGSAIFSAAASAFTAVANVAAGIWSGVTAVVSWAWTSITGTSATGGEAITTVFDAVGKAGRWFSDVIATTFDVIGYVFSHAGDTADLAGTSMALALVKAGNVIGYEFGTVVPAYISYFANNAGDVFRTFSDYSIQVMANLAGNVYEIFRKLPGLIAGTTDWSEVWTPLTTGFESSLVAMPEIAGRVKGELEKSLESQRDAIADGYGKGLGDAMAKRQAEALTATKSITATIASAFKVPEFKTPEIKAPEVPKVEPLKITPTLDPSALTLSVQPEIKRAKAVVSGSAESAAARFRGPRVDPSIAYAGPSPISLLLPARVAGPTPVERPAAPTGLPSTPIPAPASASAAAAAAAPPAAPVPSGPLTVVQAQSVVGVAYRSLQAAQSQARAANDATPGLANLSRDAVRVRLDGYQKAQAALADARKRPTGLPSVGPVALTGPMPSAPASPQPPVVTSPVPPAAIVPTPVAVPPPTVGVPSPELKPQTIVPPRPQQFTIPRPPPDARPSPPALRDEPAAQGAASSGVKASDVRTLADNVRLIELNTRAANQMAAVTISF